MYGEENSCVDINHPERGNTHAYGSLEVAEVSRMYYESDEFATDDSYFISLSNAIHDMIENAREIDPPSSYSHLIRSRLRIIR